MSKSYVFSVDGHEFDHPDANLAGDGQFAPFWVFNSDDQDYVSGPFPTRAEAEESAREFRAMAEAPAMVAALRDLVKGNYGQPWAVNVPALDPARAILSRIDGATPIDEPAPPTADARICQHCGEERPLGPDSSVWTCGACNGLNCD